MENFALILAGLGFYFIGVGGIRTSLQQVPGRRFRELIGPATRHPLRAAFTGFLTGVVTQTSIGVSVILAGLVARGMVTLRQALPVVAWSNVGLVVLVFLGSVPIHVFALALVGICGICLNFNLGGRFLGFMGPFFSLGMLLYGLRLLKVAFQSLSAMPAMSQYLDFLSASHVGPFLFAALLRVPIQSSSAIAVIGVVLNQAGLLSESQAIVMLYGTALGTGLAAFTLTSHFQGIMRQITLFEALINSAVGVVLLALFYVESGLGVPLVHATVAWFSPNIGYHVAYAFLFQQLLCAAVAYAILPRAPGWLERLAPTTREQDLSRPRYIYDEAANDIETGLTLAEQELAGLLHRLPGYLPTAGAPAAPHPPTPAALHNASLAILRELDAFLGALSEKRNKSHQTSLAILQTKRRVDLVMIVEDGVYELAQSLAPLTGHAATTPLAQSVAEALDAQLHVVIEAATSRSPEDLALLAQITRSSAESVDRIREKYLRAEHELEHDARVALLAVTAHYERIVWGLHRFSKSLATAAEA